MCTKPDSVFLRRDHDNCALTGKAKLSTATQTNKRTVHLPVFWAISTACLASRFMVQSMSKLSVISAAVWEREKVDKTQKSG